MSNAFAPLQQARPCPTLGRPVRLRAAPIDYGPAVLRMPFGFRLTTDTCPPEDCNAVASGSSWLCPTFAFVPV
jgi:hypothetical protein